MSERHRGPSRAADEQIRPEVAEKINAPGPTKHQRRQARLEEWKSRGVFHMGKVSKTFLIIMGFFIVSGIAHYLNVWING